jgi:DNA polymerase-3 subunit gamma/tau
MLAEKYRPKTFENVIGQDKVIRAMRHYLDNATSGMAFLLTGPSGSGKTTLAECAARYWGVADWDIHRIESAECDVAKLRELASNMLIYGVGNKGRKCYVIDEVHTVTGRAADRLLSLLESLPPHVLIVGTTTETGWTDGILLSRWVRCDLQKAASADVARYLEHIAEAERLPIPEDPKWADKLVKYHGLNIRDHLNQLPARLFGAESPAAPERVPAVQAA